MIQIDTNVSLEQLSSKFQTFVKKKKRRNSRHINVMECFPLEHGGGSKQYFQNISCMVS